MFILEVFIDTARAFPHNRDRVKYGPFDTRNDAEIFFNRGLDPAHPESPVFDKDHKVITDLGAILNDPAEGVHWAYKA